jgi:D-alanyl-D-alanine carboxypeptidase
MLLNHTSGLFGYVGDEALRQQVIADPTRRWSPEELIAIATAHEPTFPPGQGWSYSNTGYIVAGLMLEAASGQPLERLVRQRIIRPLDLTGTSFPTAPSIAGYHAHGYFPPSLTGDGYVDVTRLSPSVAWAAGGMVSTAGDLRRFYAALLGGDCSVRRSSRRC